MPAQRVWFTHGPHAGMCVEDLVESFLKQEVRPEGLTPLVEVAWRKNLFVVFGNRRWWALKEFCRRHGIWTEQAPQVRVLVHQFR